MSGDPSPPPRKDAKIAAIVLSAGRSSRFAPLNKLLDDSSLTSPDFEWNDMAAGARSSVSLSDGTILALPAFIDPWVLFYRKDLYAQKGWKPPRTLAEMEQHAQAFHAPPGMYGIVYRGLKNANAPAAASSPRTARPRSTRRKASRPWTTTPGSSDATGRPVS